MSDIRYAPEAIYRKIDPLVKCLQENEINLAGIAILKDGTWIVINDEELDLPTYLGYLEMAGKYIYTMRE